MARSRSPSPQRPATNEEGYLRIDVEEFLHTREALARIERVESKCSVVAEAGIARATLRHLYNDSRDLYLHGEAEDERIDEALDDLPDLEEVTAAEAGRLEGRIRAVVQEEVADE